MQRMRNLRIAHEKSAILQRLARGAGGFAAKRPALLTFTGQQPGRTRMALAAETASASARRDPKAVEAAIGALAAKFGNRLVTSQAVREQHGNILTWIENQPPDAVVFPQSTEDVQDAVRICVQHQVPVIPFGTGTSLEGHINAPHGGVSHRLPRHEPRSRRACRRP